MGDVYFFQIHFTDLQKGMKSFGFSVPDNWNLENKSNKDMWESDHLQKVGQNDQTRPGTDMIIHDRQGGG